MSEGGKLGTAYYELIPSMRGAQQQITSVLSPASAAAGAEAGAGIGATLLGGLKKFAGPIAVLAAGFSVKKVIEDSEQAFNTLAGTTKTLARIAGGTTEQVSALAGGMKLAGLDSDKAQVALTVFAKNLGNANDGGKKTAEMIAKLGGNFRDANGQVKPMSEILPILADKFKSMPNGAEKTALAMSLFGRSGAQVIPFLNNGAAGIDQFTAKAKAMGLVLDDTSLRIWGQGKVAAREYNAAILGVKASLGQDLAPVLEGFASIYRQALIPVMQAASGFLVNHRDAFLKVGEALTHVGEIIGKVVSGGIAKIGPVFGSIAGAIGPVFAGIGRTIGPLFAQLGPVFQQLLPPLLQLWTQLSPIAILFRAIQPILPQLITLFTGLATTLSGALLGVIQQILPIITQLASIFAGVLAQVISALLPVITSLVGVVAQLIPVILPLISAVLGLVAPIVSLIAPLLQLVGPILQPLIALFVAILKPILALIQPLLGLLVPALQFVATVLQVVITWIAQAITWFVKLVTGNKEAGQQFLAVWNGIQGFFAGIGRWFEGIWKGLINGIAGMIGNVIGFFQSIPQRIGDVFAGAGRWLWDAGVNIVNGLINGIKSMAGNIGRWFLSVIPAWIKAPFMAALGIHSPSTVFHEFGQNTMQGYIDGISSKQQQVQATATAVGTLTAPPPLTAPDGTPGTASQQGPATVEDATVAQLLRQLIELIKNARLTGRQGFQGV